MYENTIFFITFGRLLDSSTTPLLVVLGKSLRQLLYLLFPPPLPSPEIKKSCAAFPFLFFLFLPPSTTKGIARRTHTKVHLGTKSPTLVGDARNSLPLNAGTVENQERYLYFSHTRYINKKILQKAFLGHKF